MFTTVCFSLDSQLVIYARLPCHISSRAYSIMSFFQAQNLVFQIMIDIFVLVGIIKNVKYETLNAVNYSHVTSNVVKSSR